MDCKQLGQEAYERYFKRIDGDAENKLLETIIADIAKREELNPEQIARTCQYANTKIFLKLFKTVNDKTFEFAVANPANVINTIQSIEAPVSAKRKIDDSLFSLDVEEKKDFPEVIDFAEVAKLEQRLRDRLDDIAIKTMEERPGILKRLIHRMHEHGPETVFISVRKVGGPEELLKAACELARVNYDNVIIPEGNFLVDDTDELLQKVAAYGKMLTEKEVCLTDLEKVASVRGLISGVKKVPGKALKTGFLYMEAKDIGTKAKGAKARILSNDPLPNSFTTKNLPRRMQPGNHGYIG